MLTLGLTTTVAGILAIVAETPRVVNALNITVVCLGLLVSVLAGLLLYIDRYGTDLVFATQAGGRAQITEKLALGDYQVTLFKYPSFDASDEEVVALCR